MGLGYGEGDGARTALRAREIGFIFQTFNLLPMLNAYENVEIVTRFGSLPRSERISRAKEMIALVGLSERMRHQPRRSLSRTKHLTPSSDGPRTFTPSRMAFLARASC